MNLMKNIIALTGGFALFFVTWVFARAYIFDVLYLIIFIGLIFDNSRLRKKLKDLGHPDDLKSRFEAQQRAKEHPPAN